MVATEWLHSAPQDIASAVLVNTSMRPFSPMHRRLRPHTIYLPDFGDETRNRELDRMVGDFVQRLTRLIGD
ncbi:MAG: hypothetical protein F9K43_00925 [Bauldia sp.]|nr:MAG: hypothetical protein F9K43_00925 [Bauldia sp.]